ncbi:MAG: 4Fe-4S binding protein [Phycisphaerales bacterium]|nr:4Fe-4S binding protein [Phycisphaerales bacterium]
MPCDRPSSSGVSLQVLPENGKSKADAIGWGRRWQIRLTVLLAVQIAMILHIIIWWIGIPFGWETLSPVEPSESIETVSEGIINAGAIFFAVTLLSTAVLGRWFCGWGCHVILLQDWCLRLLRKAGIRPRAFRSRLLMLAPFALASYMFLWPIVYRFLWAPFVEGREPAWHGFRLELLTRDLWATMPGAGVGIVFLLICGFMTVYVLGGKGFCTYGCPYGGFFAPLDRLSLRRVTVDDSCEGCAHCTAACTSNVRVHEQVATWGKVIDVGCMKTTDCIEACPNDALSMQWSMPAISPAMREDVSQPKKRWDLTWMEEIILACIMLASVLAWRGAYGLVPLLMSLGAASIVTWISWKSWRVLIDPHASFHRKVLKKSGQITRAGAVFLLLAGITVAATTQAGVTQILGMRADSLAEGLRLRILAPPPPGVTSLTQSETERANRALHLYGWAGSVARGGMGLADDPNHLLASARLQARLGHVSAARDLLNRITLISKPNQDVSIEAFMVAVSLDSPPVLLERVDALLQEQTEWSELRRIAVEWALSQGNLGAASRLASEPEAIKYAALASMQVGDLSGAIERLERYLALASGDALGWVTLGQLLLVSGDVEGADRAVERARAERSSLNASAQADLDRELQAFDSARARAGDQPSP